jgi:hypothetical protein
MTTTATTYHQVPHLNQKPATFFQPKLKINQPDDIYEKEADFVAEKVVQQKPVSVNESFFKPAPVNMNLIQRDDKEPDPAGEGISTIGTQLSENNPAFSKLTEELGDRFLAQPAELSIGMPAFLLGNYAFLWSSIFWSRNMRSHLNEFNLGTLPGLVPHFPFKTFTYSIQDEEQTQFKFDFGFDASKLVSLFNEDVFNTHLSRLAFDTSGDLNTKTPSLDISALQINLGLFNGGLELSGGFRNGVSQYPIFDKDDTTGDNYRIMQQVPGLPDLMQDRRDIRFNVSVDVLKLFDYFAPERKPFENVPIGMSPTDLNMIDPGVQRKCADCEAEEKEKPVQRKSNDASHSETTSDFENYVDGLHNSGQNLSENTKSFFENSMGYDFSAVKIHTGSEAANSARSINALAYTSGNHIVFNQNQYDPGTTSGKKLLAHELTHVVQQSPTIQPKFIQRSPENNCNNHTTTVNDPDQRFEVLRTNSMNITQIGIRTIEQILQQPQNNSFGRRMMNMGFNCPVINQEESILTNLRVIYSTLNQLQLSCRNQPARCDQLNDDDAYFAIGVCRNFFGLPIENQLFMFIEFAGLRSGLIESSTSIRSILGLRANSGINLITHYSTPSSTRTQISFYYNWFIHAVAGMVPEAAFYDSPACEIPEETRMEIPAPHCSVTGRLTNRNISYQNQPGSHPRVVISGSGSTGNLYEERHDQNGNFICVNERRMNQSW